MGKFRSRVLQTAEQEAFYPEPGQKIVKATELRGSNQVEIEYPNGTRTLVIIPVKFQKKLWIRCGSYVIIDEGEVEENAGKVTGTIVGVLYPDHVKRLQRDPKVWPAEWAPASASERELSGRLASTGLGPDSEGEEAGGEEEEDEGGTEVSGSGRATRGALTSVQSGGGSEDPGDPASWEEEEEEEDGAALEQDDLLMHSSQRNRKVVEYTDSDSDSDAEGR